MTSDFSARFYARKFPGQPVIWSGILNFSPEDLVHALFATGRAPGDRWRFGDASFWEFVNRFAMLRAYVRRVPTSGRLARSPLALSLDRSEKVGLSYALGQAVTGIFCERKLGVSHLLHLDRYESTVTMTFGPTRTRADLFGLRPAGWVVAEAKGRSNGVEAGLPAKLTSQKRSIRTINGGPPNLALGCVAAFPAPASVLAVEAWDPTPDQTTSIDLDVDRDQFLLAYYLPLVTALSLGQAVAGDQIGDMPSGNVVATDYTFAAFGALGLTLGLPSELIDVVRSGPNHSGLSQVVARWAAQGAGVATHLDGSFVRTDWQVEPPEDQAG